MKHLMNWWLICGWIALAPSVFAASQKIEQSGFITALYKK